MKNEIEKMRAFWAGVAKAHDWYVEPFFIQVWVNPDSHQVWDAVAFPDMTQDYITWEYDESPCCENEIDEDYDCTECGQAVSPPIVQAVSHA